MALKYTKLTRTNMNVLEPGKMLVEHGIVYTKLKNGDGRFAICIQKSGQRVHRSVGKESQGITLRQAEAAAEEVRVQLRTDRFQLPKGRKCEMGFKESAQKYMERLEQEGGSNLWRKKQQLKVLVPFFGNAPLRKMTSFDIERLKKHLKDKGYANSTVNRYLCLLSHLFNKATEWGWIQHPPCKAKKYKEDNGRIVYLTTNEIHRLLEAAKESSNQYVYPFIVIGLATGMRLKEILSIRIENIHLDKRIIFIPHAKAGSREQPIPNHLVEFLADYLRNNCKPGQEWLFPAIKNRNGKAQHFVAIEAPFRDAVKRAGMDPKQVNRHTLRHTCVTHLVQAGVDLPTVKRISGHKTLQMVERYAHQNGAHIQEALNKLEMRYHKPN